MSAKAASKKQKVNEMQIIAELVEMLKNERKTVEATNVLLMSEYVQQMELKLDTALKEVSELKEKLAELNREQEKASLTQYLGKVSGELKGEYQGMKTQLNEIKTEMKSKAGEIVAEVKLKGKQGLNGVVEFLKIKERIEKFRDKTEEQLEKVETTIARIDDFGKRMRASGREMANAVRTFAGRPEKEYVERSISKTEIVKKPFVREKDRLEKMMKLTENVLERCIQLSFEAEAKENAEEQKPQEERNEKEMKATPFKKAMSR